MKHLPPCLFALAAVAITLALLRAAKPSPLAPSGLSVSEVAAILDAHEAASEACARALSACVDFREAQAGRCGMGP